MIIFGGKRIRELEAEVAKLQSILAQINGMDAVQIAEMIARSRSDLAALESTRAEVRAELQAARDQIVVTEEMALLQEVGIYQYRHPLDDAVAYRSELKRISDTTKALAKDGAVDSVSGWTVNGSTKEGAKMTRDLSKLMLRAYNSEADNIVRTLRPYALDSAIARLDKARDIIAKLGTIVHLRITENYHRLRIRELELTADFLAKNEEEKERLKEERAKQREEEKAMRELEQERRRLKKEQTHYQTALEKVRAGGDPVAIAAMEAKVAQIDAAITGIENREANIRAGYVYVISNFGSFGDRVVKIGLTRRLEPMDRVRELGDASVPFNFDVHALIFSDDAVGLENKLHARFSGKRVNLVNMRREYFYVSPGEVRDALVEIGGQQLLEFRDIPEAPEWRASGGLHRSMDSRSTESA